MKRCGIAGAPLSVVMCVGCGTVQNLTREQESSAAIYGGVDIATDRFKPDSRNNGFALAMFWLAYAADVALSAIGDTLTLPVTVPAEILNGYMDYYFPQEKPAPPADDESSHPTPERIHGGIQ